MPEKEKFNDNDVTVELLTRRVICDAKGFAEKYGGSGLNPTSELLSPVFRELAASNPYADDNTIMAVLGRVGRHVVSEMLLVPDMLYFDSSFIPWTWGQSFVTYPESRGLGIGTILVQRMISQLQMRGSGFGAFAMSPMSRRVWEKCGMLHLGKNPRYLTFLDARPALELLGTPQFLAKAGRPLMNVLYAIANKPWFLLAKKRTSAYSFEEIDRFDDRLDHYVKKQTQHPRFRRTSDVCNWRLASVERIGKPRTCRAFYMTGRDTDALHGYFIFKSGICKKYAGRRGHDFRVGTVVDLHADSQAALKALVLHAHSLAHRQGNEIFEFFGSHSICRTTARSLGMLRLGGYEMAFQPPPGADKLRRIPLSQWWLTGGESDAFYF